MAAIPPTRNTALIIDEFIRYATAHLSTVSGIVNTISQYPPIGQPGPGVVFWTGYTVAPASPSPPLPPEIVEPVDTEAIEMSESQLIKSDNATLNGSDISEATSIAFDDSVLPPPVTLEESEELLLNDVENTPDPPLAEEDKPKDNIQPIPNYKSNLKVPNELILAMRKYGIARTPLERAHFLAQTAHESLDYRFKEELASGDKYEGRTDLGNIKPGDGRRYKGRGFIQITGRANYKTFGPIAGADFEGNPAIVATKYFADTACMFWKANNLKVRCKDSSLTSIKLITKKINGGYNGLDDRIRKFTKYWTELQKDPTLWS